VPVQHGITISMRSAMRTVCRAILITDRGCLEITNRLSLPTSIASQMCPCPIVLWAGATTMFDGSVVWVANLIKVASQAIGHAGIDDCTDGQTYFVHLKSLIAVITSIILIDRSSRLTLASLI
jgi:hypothetical protein